MHTSLSSISSIMVSNLIFLGCMSQDEIRNVRVSCFSIENLPAISRQSCQKVTTFSDNVPPWRFDPYLHTYIDITTQYKSKAIKGKVVLACTAAAESGLVLTQVEYCTHVGCYFEFIMEICKEPDMGTYFLTALCMHTFESNFAFCNSRVFKNQKTKFVIN